ncbi:DNA-binding GntR family transcriptional regulator [Kribbella antiqua]|uniref:DNA-binding GntR family transcriptional regulator n=1 Tax=Kribbella antiqua TaxID=2512217 RepID=A0A4R2J6G4_9ACTN|nr:GntR family transcriptional regulator [Kribbella antiqua]TCO52118.1 DNA-binding GntR family transcriptional regulator [Kribbella antiqua]
MRLSGDSGRDRAYQYLRGTVLSDPAVSGTFINEQAVANEVGISRTPVREALLMLAAEDLVQLVPHRGAFVAPVPGREIAEMMQARGVIECWAATTSLAAGDAPVEAMSAVLEQQRSIVDKGDAKEFIELDSQFHALLVEAAGNSVLGRLYDNLRAKHVLLGVVALQRSATRRQEVLDEHQAIVDGLGSGRPEVAEKAILSHLDSTGSLLMQG